MTKGNRSVAQRVHNAEVETDSSPEVPRVGDNSTVRRYGRGATRQRGSALHASRRCIRNRMSIQSNMTNTSRKDEFYMRLAHMRLDINY
eukprot:6188576-Pleurochrysis_carterae.AAC.5